MNKGDKYNQEWGKNKSVLGTLSRPRGERWPRGIPDSIRGKNYTCAFLVIECGLRTGVYKELHIRRFQIYVFGFLVVSGDLLSLS